MPEGIKLYLKTLDKSKQKKWEDKLMQCFINIVKKLSQEIHIKYYNQHYIEKKDQIKNYKKILSICVVEEYVLRSICRGTMVYIEEIVVDSTE